jgi:hypothetical protein
VIEVEDLSRGTLTASSLFLRALTTNDAGAEPAPKKQFAPGERLRHSMVNCLYLQLRRECIALNWLLKIYCAKGRNVLSVQG